MRRDREVSMPPRRFGLWIWTGPMVEVGEKVPATNVAIGRQSERLATAQFFVLLVLSDERHKGEIYLLTNGGLIRVRLNQTETWSQPRNEPVLVTF